MPRSPCTCAGAGRRTRPRRVVAERQTVLVGTCGSDSMGPPGRSLVRACLRFWKTSSGPRRSVAEELAPSDRRRLPLPVRRRSAGGADCPCAPPLPAAKRWSSLTAGQNGGSRYVLSAQLCQRESRAAMLTEPRSMRSARESDARRAESAGSATSCGDWVVREPAVRRDVVRPRPGPVEVDADRPIPGCTAPRASKRLGGGTMPNLLSPCQVGCVARAALGD